MEGSKTPLSIWFQMLYDFTTFTNGVSAVVMKQRFGLSYNCAYDIGMTIRRRMREAPMPKLSGIVEVDETFYGGHKELDRSKGQYGIGDKLVILGMKQRDELVYMFLIENKNAETILPFIYKHVEKGSVIHHDGNPVYNKLEGYSLKLVRKKNSKPFRNGIHNNNIENMWHRFKWESIPTYGYIGKDNLQQYLYEFCFRKNMGLLFDSFMDMFYFLVFSGR